MQSPKMKHLLAVGLLTLSCGMTAQSEIALFPNLAPGETTRNVGVESMGGQSAGRPITHCKDVSCPTITFYPAPKVGNTGTTIIVCPGGGYEMLAIDYEGTEVCTWLNSIGVNAVLLRYRVPRRKGLPKHAAPLQDIQRAMTLTRANARTWGIRPDCIGVLGFSAGAHLSAMLALHHDRRTYPPVDRLDSLDINPDFCILIYPAYLNNPEPNAVPDAVAPEVTIAPDTPPTFITQNADDPYSPAGIAYALALRKAKVPCELHLYAKGGHGGGVRKSARALSEWPDRCQTWLQRLGYLTPAANKSKK